MAAKKPPILTIGFNTPFGEAIAAAEKRGVVLPGIYYGELQGIARQLAFSIAGVASLDQLQAVKDSLHAAMDRGVSFKDWKKTVAAQSLGLPDHRLDNIWRTNLQGNYIRGKWEQFQRNKDRRPFLMYDAINDSRVRPSHLAMDGTIRRFDDTFWKTHSPPNGYRCRCSLISLTEDQAKQRNGLNKTPTDRNGLPAMPDDGWEYNPFEDRLSFVEDMLNERGVTYDEVFPPWESLVTPTQDRRIAYFANRAGVSVEDYVGRIQSDIEDSMKAQDLWITYDKKILEKSLKVGYILRGTESTTKQLADLQALKRFDFERRVLNQYDENKMSTHAFLSTRQYGMHENNLGLGNVHIKLKPTVKDRTLIANSTAIHNLNPDFGCIPSPMLAPSYRSARFTATEPDVINLDKITNEWCGFIVGEVKTDDIDIIMFENEPSIKLRRKLESRRIRWAVIIKQPDGGTPFDDELTFRSKGTRKGR